MTVRIDTDLLEALKERAQKLGRSVSAEVKRMIQQQVIPKRKKSTSIPKSEGMFSHFEDISLEDLREHRKNYSKKIKLDSL